MQYPKPGLPNMTGQQHPSGYPYQQPPPPQYQSYPPQPYQYSQNQYPQNPRQPAPPPNPPNQSGHQKVPIHTAFFSNIQYNVPLETFKEFAQKYGEIANIYSLIDKKGIAFVTYYNIKSAKKAVEEADNQLLMGRPVKTNFGKKSSNPKSNPRQTCSALLVRTAVGSKLTLQKIQMEMSKFGEIYATNVIEPTLFYIKFCDIRDAQKAMNGKDLMNFNGENVNIVFKLDDEDMDAIALQQQYQQRPPPNYPYPYPPPTQQQMQYPIPQQPPQYGMAPNNPYGAPQQFYGAPNQQGQGVYPPPSQQQTINQPPPNNSMDDKFKFLDFLGHR
ncbi:putative RNA-binding protein [Histomonas meleagridis]|uniref:putative RNA-binding protein n=1 Tax=Histomonas meleagridis TaxID=135588 RepID=UPI003559D6D8|nr:putative RNA-binding protein [Histomonas meleagridis]KAH0804882.1 putative RNA-binding protein [Histomonas meleagridis]